MEGGLVLPLLLELLSQLKQALPPPVQHPQLRAGPAVPPIKAFAGRGRVSYSPCLPAEAPQVERSSSTHTERFPRSADINTGDGRVTRAAHIHSVSCKHWKSRTGGEEQAEAAALTLAGSIHSPPLSAWNRKGGQRKWESVSCLTGRALSQSLLGSASASAQPSESWRSRYCKVMMPCMVLWHMHACAKR